MLSTFKQNHSPSFLAATTTATPTATSTTAKTNKTDFSSLIYASFFLLLSAINLRQSTIHILSQELSSNTTLQQSLNTQTSSISFAVTPDGATQTQITQIQNQNQNYSAQRANIQNLLITTRQTGQTVLANTSTSINLLQQLAAQDSAFLTSLSAISKSVNTMNQPSA
ncbi:Uncharacterized protein CLAVI_000035 [Candidatus Clavichlamydia salmonicola]|uniref:DUF720 domain-containing protein n=1 Tax=Candidatus Clavichlamydia salmonicola TaxID=469812 RepID=UPI00189108C7|nr:DUF720 domain-containing protein [Candidatus Clavichlamydia salmonicola]MBF5050433.1 Uncharacterized protein [Candidatus Clavichlamydia salmonicola]